MSIDTIIKEAFNKNPLGFEKALKEELRARVALALEAKMSDEENLDEGHGVYRKGGSIGNKNTGEPIKVHDNIGDAKMHAKRLNSQLSTGEKKYYGIKYYVKQVDEGFAIVRDKTDLDEVSKDTVRSYADRAFRQANTILKRSLDDQPKAVQKASAGALERRKKGIKMSGKRLGKDEMQSMADKARDEKY